MRFLPDEMSACVKVFRRRPSQHSHTDSGRRLKTSKDSSMRLRSAEFFAAGLRVYPDSRLPQRAQQTGLRLAKCVLRRLHGATSPTRSVFDPSSEGEIRTRRQCASGTKATLRCGTLASSDWPQALSRTRDANAVGTNRFSIEAVISDRDRCPRGAPSRAVSACMIRPSHNLSQRH
jgi:hypothetical protein